MKIYLDQINEIHSYNQHLSKFEVARSISKKHLAAHSFDAIHKAIMDQGFSQIYSDSLMNEINHVHGLLSLIEGEKAKQAIDIFERFFAIDLPSEDVFKTACDDCDGHGCDECGYKGYVKDIENDFPAYRDEIHYLKLDEEYINLDMYDLYEHLIERYEEYFDANKATNS